MVPVSSSRPAIHGATILLGVFTMTLAHGTDRLESARLVLRRIAPDDLPFFPRIHALPEVAQYLYPEGRPRSPEESAACLQYTHSDGRAEPRGERHRRKLRLVAHLCQE